MSGKRLFVGTLVVVTAAVFAVLGARHWLARHLLFSGTWLVEDANVISPEIEARFDVQLNDVSRDITGVYEYCEGRLFSETYLRFTISDANAYEVFKAEMTRGFLKEPAALPDRKLPATAKQARQWWTPPDVSAYNAGLVYFAFDDPNRTVYALACRD